MEGRGSCLRSCKQKMNQNRIKRNGFLIFLLTSSHKFSQLNQYYYKHLIQALLCSILFISFALYFSFPLLHNSHFHSSFLFPLLHPSFHLVPSFHFQCFIFTLLNPTLFLCSILLISIPSFSFTLLYPYLFLCSIVLFGSFFSFNFLYLSLFCFAPSFSFPLIHPFLLICLILLFWYASSSALPLLHPFLVLCFVFFFSFALSFLFPQLIPCLSFALNPSNFPII